MFNETISHVIRSLNNMIPIKLRLKGRYYVCYTGNLSWVQLGNNLQARGRAGRRARTVGGRNHSREMLFETIYPPTAQCTFTISYKTRLNKTLTPLQCHVRCVTKQWQECRRLVNSTDLSKKAITFVVLIPFNTLVCFTASRQIKYLSFV